MKTVEQLLAENAKLKAEIAEKDEFITVIRKNEKAEESEFLNRIAAKIRVEYRDFHDADGMEMDCDLGENFRLQLENVFAILEKNGMKLK